MLNLVRRDWNGDCGSIASYPCFSGEDKALQKPDVVKLAKLSEDAGVDFRVVLLQRKTEELVISDIWHRHFNSRHPKLYEERVLENNAASLYAQISTLDPRFYSCTHFNDHGFSSVELVGKLMGIVDLKGELAHVMRVSKTHQTVKFPRRHARFIRTLRAYNSAINGLCSRSLGHMD
mmetsp:Transcript_9463/g.10782  ORF Transcript_9463/g.10782 Transcript_9463/m.10782 type:complete len:177 (-) Transcript_9463:266-796(-)